MLLRERLIAARNAVLHRINIHSSYKAIFGSPTGELVLRHILKTGGVINPGFSSDPLKNAFRDGRRDMALQILKYVTKDQDKLLKQIESEIENDDSL